MQQQFVVVTQVTPVARCYVTKAYVGLSDATSGCSWLPTELRRYLTFQEYVEQQLQAQAAAAAAAAAAPALLDGQARDAQDAAHPEQPKKRVPWNKGRKHTALTIARIAAGTARALERPEVRQKVEQWNQSRVGVPLTEDIRERIREGTSRAQQKRLQELATAAAEKHQKLQQQVHKLRETQQLIQTIEQTVRSLQGSMPAFENDPVGQQRAATLIQRAAAQLPTARSQVEKLQEALDRHGVHDPTIAVSNTSDGVDGQSL
eukprot:gene10961-11115_t